MRIWFFLVFLIFISDFETIICDTISPGQSISGNQTLSSQNGTFELGFFTPVHDSNNYYIGIWYTISLPNKTVVWVANRQHPISDPSSSELKFLENGNLVLLNESKSQIWSTNATTNASNSTVLVLLDNGNLIIRETIDLNVTWQSFDYPTDHWLPGSKLGYNRNQKQSLISWRSASNPAPSPFSVEVEQNGTSHVLLWNRTRQYWSTGEWTGTIFRLVPEIGLNRYIRNLTFVTNENESYFTYEPGVPDVLTRFMIDSTGQLKQFLWGRNFTSWTIFWTRPSQQCEVYAFCGRFSSCNHIQTPLCQCLPGFEPRIRRDWESGDHMEGCVRRTPLRCRDDEFSVLPRMRFPVDAVSVREFGNDGDSCRLTCMRNCSCNAYAYDDGECSHWNGEIFNFQQLGDDDTTGREIYVRASASDLILRKNVRKSKSKNTLWIILGVIFGAFFIIVMSFGVVCLIRRRKEASKPDLVEGSLMIFKYRDLKAATKNFSEKLGEGGFGTVYKGTLGNSSVVAVKRLKNLSQEKNQEKQFRVEVGTIGTIQHVNLVRLRGFCTQDSSRFLVFDYLINGSLESKLFPTVLDWKTRYKIAIGTARGLAYLHEKCRDCIIHCDIKPENILLDSEYNPKIADFGLAKLIGRDFSRVLTTIRGTRGYLAPEWISGEPITPKADVFSYGMLLLEIVSGKRNRDQLVDGGSNDYFPARVAKRINEGGEVMSLLDTRLDGNGDEEEISRVCKVACWCIQDEEKNRPSMGVVVQILEGLLEVAVHPIPQFLQGFVDDSIISPLVFLENSSASTHSSL